MFEQINVLFWSDRPFEYVKFKTSRKTPKYYWLIYAHIKISKTVELEFQTIQWLNDSDKVFNNITLFEDPMNFDWIVVNPIYNYVN